MELLEGLKRYLRGILGSRLDEMLIDRASAFERLGSDCRDERLGALLILDRCWKIPSDVLIPICDEIIEKESDAQIKGLAISIVGRFCRSSFNETRSRSFAHIALNSTQEDIVRSASVFALKQINEEDKGPFEHNDDWSPARKTQKLLDQGRIIQKTLDLRVDWEWVKSYL